MGKFWYNFCMVFGNKFPFEKPEDKEGTDHAIHAIHSTEVLVQGLADVMRLLKSDTHGEYYVEPAYNGGIFVKKSSDKSIVFFSEQPEVVSIITKLKGQ